MDLEKIIVPKDTLQNVVNSIEYNKVIIKYYKQFADSGSILSSMDLLNRKAERLAFCNKFWQLDKYEQQKIKDFKKTSLCHDKFCSNCKKVKQAARMSKYIPELEKYKDNLYHLVLTNPNCNGQDLGATVKKMSKCFKKLINFMTGHNKIKGINFNKYHYSGAVRSLEVTFHGDSYHPHFHVGIVLDYKQGKKRIVNTYSYNNKNGFKELKRMFSVDEILIQKIWYLLMNDIKVTKENIDNLKEGYSCLLNSFAPGDYAELFKYITKENDENGHILTYDNFVTLYYGLYRVKQIQGYGCLYQIDDNLDLEELDRQYEEYIEEIRKKESPLVTYEEPKDLILDTQYKLISRKTYFKYLKSL